MKPTKSKAILQCTQTTATFLFILLGSLFVLTGCAQLYRTIGLSDEQTATQIAKDQASRQEITDKIRLTTTELVLTITSGLGAIASGLLAKWLGTERKITTALITGVEVSNNNSVKETIKAKATSAGIEPLLNKRVIALT
ncbi:hypothetical protein ES707_19618 [subsurface metagenome]